MDTVAIDPRVSNPHVSGNQAPVRVESTLEPNIRGTIPQGLRGALFRNGPNPQFDPGPNYHPFIGDGMIHGFWLAEGQARYANRYVRTPRWLTEHAAGRPLFGGMGLPSDPSVEKLLSGGANTHIVHHAGRLMALQEGSNPFELAKGDLTSKGWVETGGRFTAHPKIDPDSGEMLWFAYSSGEGPLNPYLDYGISDASGRIQRRGSIQGALLFPWCTIFW